MTIRVLENKTESRRPFSVPPKLQGALKEDIKRLLSDGIIRKALCAHCSSPAYPILKRNGNIRHVKILGQIISEAGIRKDISRIKDLQNPLEPKSKHQFQKMIGDTSAIAIGAVLYKHHRTIGFTSRRLTKAKSNHTNTELELLEIVKSLEHF
ncbi:hypothetical protein RF11_04389 [Thelohanellus kitauei]|uniref:Reverse transcriptase/retrotransposon-derived protein RNase H-like domain-containing protein n=1 Tax=Thelohanellus kitauei TaxID=669202 RepID=A0A0C2MF43_THEKT|nr:hypothetical protein RF11_04389 [Thelohanellus kitauei]